MQQRINYFSILAHDLKNPLNTVINFTKLVQMHIDKISDEERTKFLKLIYNGAISINELLDNLLIWSRSQTEAIAFIPERTDLTSLIEQNCKFLSQNAIEKNITLIPQIMDDIEPFIDRNMIDTVLRNLISNVIKFTGDKGIIAIKVEKGDPQVKISIIDNGVGMDQEKVDSLFDISTNTSTKGTNKEGGSGLGLLICKEFIDSHNGTITVDSQIDRGSAFIIEI